MSNRRAWIAWCAPAAFLAAVVGGVAVVLARPPALLWIVLGTLGGAPIAWVLVSALFPAKADRRCPACGRDDLVRLDPHSTHGLGCDACGWRDESASGWLLAEEEGPLEELVLAQRARGGAGPMDSPRRGG